MQARQSPDDSEAEIHRVCSILESIANQYAPSTAERRAIDDAAIAFVLVHRTQSLRAAYRKWKTAVDGELTPAMWNGVADRLRSLGIDPDEFDADDDVANP